MIDGNARGSHVREQQKEENSRKEKRKRNTFPSIDETQTKQRHIPAPLQSASMESKHRIITDRPKQKKW